MNVERSWGGRVVFAAVLSVAVSGCRTVPALPPINVSQPGWVLQQGQATWQPSRSASEIAGEILFATGQDGNSLLQFTKTPLPFVTAQTSNDVWRIEFVPEKRSFSGRGTPTPRLLWVHLARALAGQKPPEPLEFRSTAEREWQIENRSTGERIAGYLN